MRLIFACACGRVDYHKSGAVSLIGVLDRLVLGAIPGLLGDGYLVCRFEADFDDNDREQTLTLELVDEDGRQRFNKKLEVGAFGTPAGAHQVLTKTFPLRDTSILTPGRHRWTVRLEGGNELSFPLECVRKGPD
jgi:hypothetical protein